LKNAEKHLLILKDLESVLVFAPPLLIDKGGAFLPKGASNFFRWFFWRKSDTRHARFLAGAKAPAVLETARGGDLGPRKNKNSHLAAITTRRKTTRQVPKRLQAAF